ncbi:MAG: AI-2E family transporter, partial [Myxococcales bacterium]
MRLDKPHDWRTVAGTVAIALAVALLAAGFLLTIRVFLLGFAAILVAVLLRALADPLASLLQLKRGWGLLLVVLALLATIAVGGTLLGPRVAEQGEEFLEQIPAYVEAAQRRLAQSQWGRQLLRSVRGTLSGDAGSGTELLGRVTGVLALPLNALVQLFIVLVVGLYLAANPSLYTGGAIRLVPLALRPGARELVHALATTLRWFLIARVVSMLAVGLLTWLTLWALGVPL